MKSYDVAIIGAGIIGSVLAESLSRYDIKTVIIDKEPQAGFGVTKGSLSYIHKNHFNRPGSLRAELCSGGNEWYRKKADFLGLDYGLTNEISIAFNDRQLDEIKLKKDWAEKNGEKGYRFMSVEELHRLEPNVNTDVLDVMISPDNGMIHPPEWAFALVDHAVENGVEAFFRTEVAGIREEEGVFFLKLRRGGEETGIKSRYVVNAAGLFVDGVASMIGDEYIELSLQRASYAIFDKDVASTVSNIIYVGGLDLSYSQVMGPTVHGNMILGMGHFVAPGSKGDTEISSDVFREVLDMGYQICPELPENKIITSFSAIKSSNTITDGDFYIDYSSLSKKFIHAVICSPGVTGAPGISDYIIDMLSNSGLDLRPKNDYEPYRNVIHAGDREDEANLERLISLDPGYGRIICRCENVSMAEIEDAIRRGADTLDGVKHVTRAGMGRCQGGFCSSWIISRLAELHGGGIETVTKRGGGSEIVRDLL